MSRGIVDQYEQGGSKLTKAISGLTTDELIAVPIPGKWSTHQVVIHLADAEASFADRIKRIIAMDHPTLLAWDENKFFANLCYGQQSAEDAVKLIELIRRQTTRVLNALPDEAFARTGEHSERGTQTLEAVIGFANWHLDHHLKFIAEKRAKLGK
jgi:DinB superfamily